MNESISNEILNLVESKNLTPQEKNDIKNFINKNPNATADDVKKMIDGTIANSNHMTTMEKREVLNASYESEKEDDEDYDSDEISEYIVTDDVDNNSEEYSDTFKNKQIMYK